MLEIDDEDMGFLMEDVQEWENSAAYVQLKNFIKPLRVVNDTAERGVKLIQDFVSSTTNEELRQEIMLAVSADRKKRPIKNLTKKMLA